MRLHCRRFTRGSRADATILPSFAASLILLFSTGLTASPAPAAASYEYLSPLPGSRHVSPWNNVVIRQGGAIDARTLAFAEIRVVGSASGTHDGSLVLSDDARTLVFNPDEPFALGETVAVSLAQGVKTRGGELLAPLAFEFVVAAVDPREQPRLAWEELLPDLPAEPGAGAPAASSAPSAPFPAGSCDLPPGYPAVSVTTFREPEAGHVFLVPFGRPFASSPGHLLILDNLGMPIFYRRIASGAIDLKLQPNGLLTYHDRGKAKHYVLDSAYAIVDSLVTGNGYVTDLHDLQWLPDGHWLLMSYDPQPVRMDEIVPGGDPDAIVVGLIIQELDREKNVVFQWRSWDHMEITDTVVPLTERRVDYVHGNAVELDHDGNILVSSRNINEITKIDRRTGAIVWRMGLHARNNEFDFVDDSRSFWFQHDIRRLPNGNVTLYDNGNGHNPIYSRGVEYRLDEEAKTATQVWEYRDAPDVFGPVMGNVQRRASGGTMIGWGYPSNTLRLTDLLPDGSKALEVRLPIDVLTYRGFRFPWRGAAIVTDVESLDFGPVLVGRSATRPLSVRNGAASEITIGCFLSSDPAFAVEAPVPITLSPGETATVDVRFVPSGTGAFRGKLYVRSVTGTEVIAQDVTLEGAGAIELAFDFEPNTFNLRSLGRWASGTLQPEEPLAAADIDPASIRLNGRVAVDPAAPRALGDHDGDGIPDLGVKFPRSELALILPPGERVPVTVTGTIGAQSFVGFDTVRVKGGRVVAPAGNEVVAPGRPYPVRYEVSAGEPARYAVLLHSLDGGASWNVDLSHQPNTGEMIWNVPNRTAGGVRLAVVEVVEEVAPDQVAGVLGVSDEFAIAEPLAVGGAPGSLELAAVRPNPGRGAAALAYALPRRADVSLTVLDVQGRRVRTLVSGAREAGWHEVRWGGETDAGGPAGAGLYFVKLHAEGRALTRRVVRLR